MQNLKFSPRISTNFDTSSQESEYLKNLANEYFSLEQEEKKRLTTKEAVIARRKDIQQKFKKAVGVLPDRNAPLNVTICNEHTLPEGVVIRNITYESVPGIKVTATIYLPKDYLSLGKMPAVIVPCGHSPSGRAHDTYSALSRMLARNNMVVLCPDPPGQHERVQYPDKNGASRIGGAVAEHFQIGFPCHLTGLTLAAFFVRDLERAVDVLETLSFIDSKRIGISGCSGGGLMTGYMALWDDRFAAAAPSCFITTREASLMCGRPVDPEQIVPRVIQEGINHDDFMALFAPRPHLICVAESDPVDIGGAVYTHNIARSVYKLFDAEENARIISAPTGHGLFEKHRTEITRFMAEVLSAPVDKADTTLAEPISPELLMCTKTGSLLTDDPYSKSLFDYYNEYIKENKYTDCDRKSLRKRVLDFLKTPKPLDSRGELLFPDKPINKEANQHNQTEYSQNVPSPVQFRA